MASACVVRSVDSACRYKARTAWTDWHERLDTLFGGNIPVCRTACYLLPQQSMGLVIYVYFHIMCALRNLLHVHTVARTEKQNSKTVNLHRNHHSFWAEEKNTGNRQAQTVYFSEYVGFLGLALEPCMFLHTYKTTLKNNLTSPIHEGREHF